MAIELAVWHEGMPVHPDDHVEEAARGKPSQGRWVIATYPHAVTGDMCFLLCDPTDGSFYAWSADDCIVFKMITPDMPRPVVPVQMGTSNQQNGLVIPEMNRQMRRNGHN